MSDIKERLRKTAACVYLAAEEGPATDISNTLIDGVNEIERLERDLAQQQQREKLAAWMLAHGFATGHGDTLDDLLTELSWQVKELKP